MKHQVFIILAILFSLSTSTAKQKPLDLWPDGTPIDDWFTNTTPIDTSKLGKQYILTDNGIFPDGRIHTTEIQALIDKASNNGGGVIVVPEGVFITGGLHFKQGTHLYLRKGATLLGSDFIGDYPFGKTRIEGETCPYFGALINAEGLDGFTISGKGTIDGNGLKWHQMFWMRMAWNPKATNKDTMRPRLVFLSHCKNVQIEGVNLQNSGFWTTHLFNCENVKILGCHFYSLANPDDSKAPCTDAIDLDVVKNVLVKNCYMAVNDDAIAIKGGKGPYADAFMTDYPGVQIPSESIGNGANQNILIEDCEYGFCHGCLVLGSESVFDHNIILRRINITSRAKNLLWLKMRPDTPQHYEYITIEDVKGPLTDFLLIKPWTQYYNLKGRKDNPLSYSDHITIKNCNCQCDTFFNVQKQEAVYRLSKFHFENLNITADTLNFRPELIDDFTYKNLDLKEQ